MPLAEVRTEAQLSHAGGSCRRAPTPKHSSGRVVHREHSGTGPSAQMGANTESRRTIALFDVDGTLVVPRKVLRSCPSGLLSAYALLKRLMNSGAPGSQKADQQMLQFLQTLRKVPLLVLC